MDEKSKIRANVKRLFDSNNIDELNTFSSKINAKLFQKIQQKKIRTLAVFSPLKDEPNIWPFLKNFFKKNTNHDRKILFPKINLSSNEMEFFWVEGKHQLELGSFGILEPVISLPTVDLNEIDAILVPGVAFDHQGHRLGRGKGFYDKFLAQLPKTTVKIGVCFPFQYIEKVPVEQWDQRVDTVICA